MANNFADDARIIEFWRFENNLTAGKNGNDLTDSAGGVLYVNATTFEGDYYLRLWNFLSQWAYRTDANLSAGFPLKSGDTTKKGSIAFWLYSLTDEKYIITKYNSTANKRSLAILRTGGNLVIYWGHTNGTAGEVWTVCALSSSTSYHIGLSFDGVAKTASVRVYTGGTATTYTNTFTNELSVSDESFVVGNRGQLDNTYCYNGYLDEIVVANDVLSVAEFDQIRAGTFGTAVSLVISNLASSNAVGSPSLTQKHNIAVASVSHTHAATEPVLQLGTTSLVLANLAHENSLSAPVLTQLHNLVTANLAHANSLGAPVLTQAHNITVQGAAHTHALDNVTFTQLHNLAVANAAHAMTLDAPVLTRIITLAVQNALMEQAITTPSLT